MGKHISCASDPGNLKVSKKMLKAACPGMFGFMGITFESVETFWQMRRHLEYGDSQPAIVYSLSPFLIAAYSDEMDAVVMVRFNDRLAKLYGIVEKQRLISVNTYVDGKTYNTPVPKDITPGPDYLDRWTDFTPCIGDLLSRNKMIMEGHKKIIPESIWRYVETLAGEYAKNNPGVYRDGSTGLPRTNL